MLNRRPTPLILILFTLTFWLSACDKEEKICIPEEELKVIGELIFINEGAGKEENLTVWNEGEEFASLGIGHFLWYPAGKEYRFFETFPAFLEFAEQNGAEVPSWILEMPEPDLPWSSREEFLADLSSPRMVSLRQFLQDTVPLQTLFIARRLESGVPEILAAAPKDQREHIKKQFYRVAESPMGMYVLIDYVNFKGEGTAESERYNGQGWGLLQVLSGMKGEEPGHGALLEFAENAHFVLLRRVQNSPPERNEKRWMPGWKNRLKTYHKEEYIELAPKREIYCKESSLSSDRAYSFFRYMTAKFTGGD